jgi:hypothetical protein
MYDADDSRLYLEEIIRSEGLLDAASALKRFSRSAVSDSQINSSVNCFNTKQFADRRILAESCRINKLSKMI